MLTDESVMLEAALKTGFLENSQIQAFDVLSTKDSIKREIHDKLGNPIRCQSGFSMFRCVIEQEYYCF